MSDEMRSAVERLRKYEAGDADFTVYEDYCRAWANNLPAALSCSVSDLGQAYLDADRELLANAYLAEHPADDDEEISLGWLNKTFGSEDCFATEIHAEWGEAITWVSGIGDIMVPMPKTRGDLRRLATALGITLKESA